MASRQPPQPPQARDVVYCHQCENEWYRDEHGLACPECHSDFTEIIEANHDPRDDEQRVPADTQIPAAPDQGFYGAPDPDEEDIEGLQWRQTGPGQMRATYHFNGSAQPGQPQQGQQAREGQGLGGGLLGAIGSILQGALGAGAQQQQEHQQQPDQAQPQQRPQSLDAGGPGNQASSAPGGARAGTSVRRIQFPGGAMTITTAANINIGGDLGPRNANGPQPFQLQPQHIDQMMQHMFMNIAPGGGMGGGAGRAPGGGVQVIGPGGMMFGNQPGIGMGGQQHPAPFMAGGPFANFFHMMGMPMAGAYGDAVFSQEDLDRVVTQLMEQHQSGNAPGPAPEAAIENLPTKTIESKDLDDSGKADCSICMDDVHIGSVVTVLPCSHWFHADCIKAWLTEHDTCPHCRKGIMPEGEPNTNNPRQPSQAPLNNMNPASGQTQPQATVQERPATRRRASSTSATGRGSQGSRQGSSSSGGVFKKMRDAFGGGGGGSAGGSSSGGGGGSTA